MRRIIIVVFFLFFLHTLCVRGESHSLINHNLYAIEKRVLTQDMISKSDTTYCIQNDYDLKGESIIIPDNCVLRFDGGRLFNGTLVGKNTRIDARDVTVFYSINIKGSWDCPRITSHWFDTTKDNSIVELINLASDNLYNEIIIEKQRNDYWVSSNERGTLSEPKGVLAIPSNTKLDIRGVIRQRGNKTNFINLLLLKEVHDIIITGGGRLYGEKELHDYTNVVPILPTDNDYKKNTHENNHVICIHQSNNILIDGIHIFNATGDGIDVLNYDKNVNNNITIRNFSIENCRRQGISVEGQNIIVEHGSIKNIHGTMPMSGIDVEISVSRKGRIADNIILRDIAIENCLTAFQTYTSPKDPATITNIRFEAIKASNINRGITISEACKDIIINDCNFVISPRDDCLTLNNALGDNVYINNCSFACEKKVKNDNDFTLFRTRAYNQDYIENKVFVKNCKFKGPYINFFKRANHNTTIDSCDIKCLKWYCVNTATGSIIRNSSINIEGYSFYLDAFDVEGCNISTGACIEFSFSKIVSNIITITKKMISNSCFKINKNSPFLINSNEIFIKGNSSPDYIIDNSTCIGNYNSSCKNNKILYDKAPVSNASITKNRNVEMEDNTFQVRNK